MKPTYDDRNVPTYSKILDALEDAYAELDGIVMFYYPDGRHADDLSDARKLLPELKSIIERARR